MFDICKLPTGNFALAGAVLSRYREYSTSLEIPSLLLMFLPTSTLIIVRKLLARLLYMMCVEGRI